MCDVNNEALTKYRLAREDAGQFMDRIYSLAQVVAAAARSPDAQLEVNLKAVGILSEVIGEDVKQVEEIFDRYLDELTELGG